MRDYTITPVWPVVHSRLPFTISATLYLVLESMNMNERCGRASTMHSESIEVCFQTATGNNSLPPPPKLERLCYTSVGLSVCLHPYGKRSISKSYDSIITNVCGTFTALAGRRLDAFQRPSIRAGLAGFVAQSAGNSLSLTSQFVFQCPLISRASAYVFMMRRQSFAALIN